MAENEEAEVELSSGEAAELEALLDDPEGKNKKSEAGLKDKVKKVFSNKKALGVGSLLLLVVVGAGIYIFLPEEKETLTDVEEKAIKQKGDKGLDEKKLDDKGLDDKVHSIEKVNIYKLEPFFLPIFDNGKETGRFISISANLLLNNRVMYKDLDRALPLVRKSIYSILSRKSSSDFTLQRANTEEKIKKEILNASNALLLSGTGTVTDVFFSNFMVK